IVNGLPINFNVRENQRARGLGDSKGDKGDASQVEPLVPLEKQTQLPILDVKYLRNKTNKILVSNGNMVFAKDRLILMDGENSGEIFIANENGFLGSTLKKLDFSAIVKIEFMDYLLLSYKDLFKGNKKGAAIPHLDRQLFLNLRIPLPPLKEQEYITHTLDTLFTLTKGLKCE
ncbi:restriction endonuclease subunit S, partial [Campylobacter sp. MIT 21-1685]|uniref:restriction endonuclease subunit S n=1 Tax=unclassified Campylobacter TaxID=2593542 RepID=UPI00224B951C